jgi:hypothetical protein
MFVLCLGDCSCKRLAVKRTIHLRIVFELCGFSVLIGFFNVFYSSGEMHLNSIGVFVLF